MEEGIDIPPAEEMMNDKLDFPGGDEDGEGPRNPRPMRLKISVQSNAVDGDDRECQGSFSHCFHPKREQKGKHCEDEEEQQTYDEEEEEGYYDDEEEEDPGSSVTVRPRLVTLTDPEVLDCYICFEPFSSPVFHVAPLRFFSQFVVLQEQNDDALFVLNNRVELIGNLVTVCCIGHCSSTRGFPFTLEAKIHGSSVRLQSFTKNSQNWLEEPPSTGFLLIPSGFYGSCDQIKLEVCIERNAACQRTYFV
ncbi:uncharacterized protein LOC132169163 [Corylus avellana]|uniref:uncharacterized protein LOC132169163 n=1 Tax=Corylus avellana TaxID=13451 RepID=UPI00286BCB53|nr:uncharacterized protein LOC132169163 [Corylus avellana]